MFAIFGDFHQEIWKGRDLLLQLLKRDLVAGYKKSFLGIAWIFLAPIIGIVSWLVMNAAGVLKPGDVGVPYPVYVFVGTSFWGLFLSIFRAAAGSLGSGASFIMQVNYPHGVLFFEQVLFQLINFGVSFFLMILALLYFHLTLGPSIFLLPIVLLPLLFASAGLGLIISVISVVLVDLNRILEAIWGVLFFFTPIIYGKDIASMRFAKWILLNPLTYLVCYPRDLVLYSQITDFKIMGISLLCSFLFFLFSWRLYRASEKFVVEKMI